MLTMRQVMQRSEKRREMRDGSKRLRASMFGSVVVHPTTVIKKGPVKSCTETSHRLHSFGAVDRPDGRAAGSSESMRGLPVVELCWAPPFDAAAPWPVTN